MGGGGGGGGGGKVLCGSVVKCPGVLGWSFTGSLGFFHGLVNPGKT